MTILIIIFICSYLAFSLSAICGGGAGLILIPLLNSVLPVSQVPAALSIGTFTSSFSRIIIFYKSISWNIVKWFVPAALPTVWLGAWLLKFVNPIYLGVVMGLFLIGNLPAVFKKTNELDKPKKASNAVLVIIGFIAGFLSGLTGVVGLIFNRFYLSYGLTKEEIVATRAANEILLHLIKIILYTLFGLITSKVILIGAIVAVSALLSSWSMKWILPKLSSNLFKKIGYSAMVLSGFAMLIQSGNSVVEINNANISMNLASKGIETQLQWQNTTYSLEFSYNEGFEFEIVIPMKELTQEQQKLVLLQQGIADKIIIEAVHRISKQKTFEAYYFKDDQLINKIYFK